MTYDDAIAFLFSLRLHGLNLGLDNTHRLAALAGNPHRQLRFIHVAGTNGKGSTCAMLESIYRSAGLRTALFTSPHLVTFRERLQVNRQPIPTHDIVRLVQLARQWVATFPPDHCPTFFEVVTAMALTWFAEQRCDLVLWETGMGGRLDATNIVTPLASVITNIDLDHEKWLGSTRAEIALEKAGILKPNIPALTATEHPDALAVIRSVAAERHAPLTVLPPDLETPLLLRQLPLPLLGAHQLRNATLALATVQLLQPLLPVTPDAIRHGLTTVSWPGRLQLLARPGGGQILLDGAHNPAGTATLQAALRGDFTGRSPVLILGILQDKDWRHMCQALAPLAQRILIVPVKSERTAAPMELLDTCRATHPDAKIHAVATLRQALDATADAPFTVITGSLYLVGEALELLTPDASGPADPHDLNDWSVPASSVAGRGEAGSP